MQGIDGLPGDLPGSAWLSPLWSNLTMWPQVLAVAGVAGALAGVLVWWWRIGRRRRRGEVRVASPYLAALHAWLAGHLERAEMELERTLDADPHHVDAALLLGRLWRQRGRPERALTLHRELLTRRGLSRRQRADVLAAVLADSLARGAAAAALAPLARELRRLLPEHPLALEVLIDAARQRGELRESIRLLEDTARRPRHRRRGRGSGVELALRLAREGDVRRAAGERDAARRCYRRALRAAEHHPAPYLGLAALAADQGREREALRWYRRAAAITPVEWLIPGLEELGTEGADALLEELAAAGLERQPERHALRRALIRLAQRRQARGLALREARRALAAGDRSGVTLRLAGELARQEEDAEAALELVLNHLPAGAAAWRCRRCGVRLRAPAWRCASCGGWDTVEPAGLPAVAPPAAATSVPAL